MKTRSGPQPAWAHRPAEPVRMHTWDGVVRGPDLQETTPDGGGWSASSIALWDSWRRTPGCESWSDGDWLVAEDSLLVRERFLRRGDSATATELRRRLEALDRKFEEGAAKLPVPPAESRSVHAGSGSHPMVGHRSRPGSSVP